MDIELPEKIWCVVSYGRKKVYHTKSGVVQKLQHAPSSRVFERDLRHDVWGWIEITEELK